MPGPAKMKILTKASPELGRWKNSDIRHGRQFQVNVGKATGLGHSIVHMKNNHEATSGRSQVSLVGKEETRVQKNLPNKVVVIQAFFMTAMNLERLKLATTPYEFRSIYLFVM